MTFMICVVFTVKFCSALKVSICYITYMFGYTEVLDLSTKNFFSLNGVVQLLTSSP